VSKKTTVYPRSKTNNEAIGNTGRDALGRFVSGGSKSSKKSDSAIIGKNIASNINNTLQATSSGLENVDPSVKAFKEISEPLKRGFGLLFNKDKGGTPILIKRLKNH